MSLSKKWLGELTAILSSRSVPANAREAGGRCRCLPVRQRHSLALSFALTHACRMLCHNRASRSVWAPMLTCFRLLLGTLIYAICDNRLRVWTCPRLCKALCKAYRAPPRTPLKLFRFTLMGLITQPLPRQRRKAGWALCFPGLQRGTWTWLGFYAAHAPIAGAEATLQTRVRSSFEPELAAAVFALAFAFRNPVPTLLGYDNEAAVQVDFGEATQTEPSMLSHAGIAVSHMLRQQGRMPAKLHIDSHSGHVLNDLADCVAKHVATSPQDSQVPENFDLASQQGVLPWLGFAANMCKDLPRIGEEGTLYSGTSARQPQDSNLASGHDFQIELPARPAVIDCRVATYNCLTVASTLQKENLDMQFAPAGNTSRDQGMQCNCQLPCFGQPRGCGPRRLSNLARQAFADRLQ